MIKPSQNKIIRYAAGLFLLFLAVMLTFFAAGNLIVRQTAVAQTGKNSPTGDNLAYLPLVTKPLPPPPLTDPYTNAFSDPTFVTHAGDDRLFVVQKHGIIQILHPNGQTSVFLDIHDRVLTEAEEGLYSLVFDPNYANNGYFYVSYSGLRYTDERWFQVVRYQATNNSADPNTECRLFGLRMDYPVHNGGGMAIHPIDGYLYLGVGDDRGLLAAQEDDSYKGKLVRLDISNQTPGSCPGSAQIIAKGLRNPWRFDFDPLTGDIYIGDVNDLTWEEINYIPYGQWGRNFGWPCMEGPTFIGFPIQAQCESVGTGDLPLYYYPHHPKCAVIGGYVLRRSEQPEPQFLYGDACTRELFLLTHTGGIASVELLGTLSGTGYMLTSFGKDYQERLYALEFPNTIYQLNIP